MIHDCEQLMSTGEANWPGLPIRTGWAGSRVLFPALFWDPGWPKGQPWPRGSASVLCGTELHYGTSVVTEQQSRVGGTYSMSSTGRSFCEIGVEA